jgi:hypothetical protein
VHARPGCVVAHTGVQVGEATKAPSLGFAALGFSASSSNVQWVWDILVPYTAWLNSSAPLIRCAVLLGAVAPVAVQAVAFAAPICVAAYGPTGSPRTGKFTSTPSARPATPAPARSPRADRPRFALEVGVGPKPIDCPLLRREFGGQTVQLEAAILGRDLAAAGGAAINAVGRGATVFVNGGLRLACFHARSTPSSVFASGQAGPYLW